MPSRNAGRARVSLGTDNSPLARGLRAAQAMIAGWGRGIEKMGVTIGNTLQGVGRGISTVGRQLVGFGAVGLAAFALPIKAASDMQETMSKFSVVFGDSAEEMQAWGDDLAAQIGRGQKMTREFLAGNQDLLVPIGIDPSAARDMSKTLVELTYDLASFNNKADADVHRDLQAALTGSSEVMKKYGVIVNQTAVNQELLNNGLDPKNATEAQKAQARLAIILRGTSAAHGDAARTSGSFANQMKALKARLQDAAAVLGAKLLPVVTPLVTKAAEIIQKMGDWAEKNGELAVMALKIVAAITAIGIALTVLGPIISAIGTVIVAGAVAFGTLLATISTLVGLAGALLSPLGLLVAGAAALVAVAVEGSGAVGKFAGAFEGLKTDAMTALEGIRAALAGGDLKLAMEIAGAALQVVWKRTLLGLQSAWVSTRDFILDVWDIVVANIAKAFIRAMNSVESTLTRAYIAFKRAQMQLGGASKEELARFDKYTGIALRVDDAGRAGRISDVDQLLEENMDARRTASAGELAKSEGELADARAKLAELNKKATAGGAPSSPAAAAAKEIEKELDKSGGVADVTAGTTAGTFNAFALRGFSQGNVAERTAKATEETAKNTQDLKDEVRRGGGRFGK